MTSCDDVYSDKTFHTLQYASMLAEKMKTHGATAWLVNTGWTAGPYGVGCANVDPKSKGALVCLLRICTGYRTRW